MSLLCKILPTSSLYLIFILIVCYYPLPVSYYKFRLFFIIFCLTPFVPISIIFSQNLISIGDFKFYQIYVLLFCFYWTNFFIFFILYSIILLTWVWIFSIVINIHPNWVEILFLKICPRVSFYLDKMYIHCEYFFVRFRFLFHYPFIYGKFSFDNSSSKTLKVLSVPS